ncbi:MAG: tetratricopeptide repeat protein [Anaerolineales bacterium]|nr:tetratricopeptide repeat protein [Anaerolineales bacterium]
MSKKSFPTRLDPINLPRKLRDGLAEAESLLAKNEPQDALNLLQELDRKFPRQPDVLGYMANACLDLGDQHGYLHAIYQLHNLTPNRPDIKLGLAGAYLATGRIALALRTFRQFLKQWPHDERATDVQKTIPQLEQGLTEMLGQMDFFLESGLDFVCKHEELQVLMELGNYERGKQLAKSLLEQQPNFVPVLNNLSQVYWLEGNLARATELSQQVLDIQPDNVHALSNLTRFLFMQGKQEEAIGLAHRLETSQAEAADLWVKKAEALSFIGDEDGVLALLDDAKQAGELDQLSESVWHWCAAAEYRKGNESKARKYWQKCLQLAPHFLQAKDNLEELKKPRHERNCPQAFSLDAWLSRNTISSLTSTVERASRQKSDTTFQDKIRAYFEDHPEILHFVPAALASGDTVSRDLALKLADMSAHPSLLAHLKEFALGQEGSDDLRLEASQILSKHGVFESGVSVTLWLGGEWKPIMMLGFQIYYDSPEKPTLKPAAQRLMEKAIYALREEKGAEGETLLRKALEIQKDEPGLLNNLAVALSMQGKHDEAEAIADEIPVRFPDYFFGQVIAVRRAIQADDLEKAKTILDKMMKKRELHVTEFGALCGCQIDFMIADDKPEGALSWFDMWKQGYPDDPALKNYEEQMSIADLLTTFKKGLSRPRRKSKKSRP